MVVYICSRYRADTIAQFSYQQEVTKKIAKTVVLYGYEVIVPHLMYTQFLDDNEDNERSVGLESAKRLLNVCDAVYVDIHKGVSVGMEGEIKEATLKRIPVFYFRNENELKDILKKSKS